MPTVILEKARPHVTVIRLNRPERLNAMSIDLSAIGLEDRNQIMLGMTDNLPEAIAAFDEGRAPVYTDEPRRGVHSSR
ncbi:MAG TPA: hypothetical protein VMW56_01990 [Candidatus Margulisiibacteriota bacterium]|nr:hypothetical protein [Candidatus Margulisiibacteriota bacterium]